RAVELVIHETVTRSVDATIAVLKKRGLGVHLVMDADGSLTQHGDLATDILWHASQHNGASFGVEVVNPYYPSYLKPGLPWNLRHPLIRRRRPLGRTPALARCDRRRPSTGVATPRASLGCTRTNRGPGGRANGSASST